jgi:hypothetical protein
MKRLLIFGLLGPPLGFVTAFWGLLQILNWAIGEKNTFDYHQVVLLPFAYAIGLVPALIVGIFDAALESRRVGGRIVWTTAFAYIVGFLPLLGAFIAGFIHGPYLIFVGLVGAIPGAICSWLATDKQSAARHNI